MLIWEGPSMLTGDPIAVLATPATTTANVKTGRMVQVVIVRADVSPSAAVADGSDDAICGDCPQRHALGGACYVLPTFGPRSTWDAWQRGRHDGGRHVARVTDECRRYGIRLGAYGDPAAVPFYVWEDLIAQGVGQWSGYTHQWRLASARPLAGLVMASCDGPGDVRDAIALGFRPYLATAADLGNVAQVEGATLIRCPYYGPSATQCEDCGACDGTRAGSSHPGRAGVWAPIHGSRARRWALPVVA
jgi:hypothetical protein